MSKPKLGIILEFGFHDVKKYIHSGFYVVLRENFDIVWLALNKGNATFDEYFRGTGSSVEYFDPADFKLPPSKTEARNQSVRRAWMQNQGLGAFHNYVRLDSKRWKNRVIGNGVLKWWYEYQTLREVSARYFSPAIASVLSRHGIQLILGIGTASAFAKSAYSTAIRSGLKAWLLVNSWKDLYINNFIPFPRLDGIIVWSERMRREYLHHMPYLRGTPFFVGGNPSFDFIGLSPPGMSRAFYGSKYRVPENAQWLYYTMSPPGIIDDELQTVILIAQRMLAVWPPSEKIILLRKNPNHSQEDFSGVPLPENLRLTEHFCEYDQKQDMITQSPEGEAEYRDLLNYCDMNLSIPSTVTLEFLIKSKRVVNIGFGSDGLADVRLEQHISAGFYRSLFSRPDVLLSRTIDRMIDNLRALEPQTHTKVESTESVVALPKNGSSAHISRLLLDHL